MTSTAQPHYISTASCHVSHLLPPFNDSDHTASHAGGAAAGQQLHPGVTCTSHGCPRQLESCWCSSTGARASASQAYPARVCAAAVGSDLTQAPLAAPGEDRAMQQQLLRPYLMQQLHAPCLQPSCHAPS
eukprot:CAMPEP_0202867168 /NCGR_PEP_ID=MMETSP1391-20130828/8855_1 /ASSEMBLY_ACC=CAM_ASM_000867 /TAXON_ID=1034604 /ORGANISM="Chlamydomonas leiostraca, Strain SAG 11-49" /LENGTH=129 /DNA_ID=CAMNT_0049547183 /DNA_START=98 /DNA_END=485 /DNA_ORIENTATION=-